MTPFQFAPLFKHDSACRGAFHHRWSCGWAHFLTGAVKSLRQPGRARVILLTAACCFWFLAHPSLARGPAPSTDVETETTSTTASQSPDETAPSSQDALDALIVILEDEASRGALLERLKALDTATADSNSSANEPQNQGISQDSPQAEPPLSITRQLAVFTQGTSNEFVGLFRQIGDAVASVYVVLTGRTPVNWDRFIDITLSLGVVAAATILTYLSTRFLAYRLLAVTQERASGLSLRGRLSLKLGWTLLDAALILASWSVGYLTALQLTGSGELRLQHAFFLNAFLASELFAVLLRAIFSARSEALRPFPIGNAHAHYWQFWLSRLAEVAIYGLLVLVPVVSSDLSFIGAEGLRVLVVVFTALLAIMIVMRGRRSVRRGIKSAAAYLQIPLMSTLLVGLANSWHVVAIVYILSAMVIWLTRPFGAVSFVLEATVNSLIGIALAILMIAVLNRLLNRGIQLPGEWRQEAPFLQRRLNGFVPRVLKAVRISVFFALLFWIFDAWDLVDASGWIVSPDGQDVAGRIFAAILTVLLAFLLHMVVISWVEHRLNATIGRAPTARERTLLTLFQNAFTIALVLVAFLLALSELNVNIAPFLAGAGVLGLAIGFGSQKLVQDIITGAFIQIENAMNEGDVVTIAGISGTVERLTIRSVGLRDLDGVYHLIPFSSVDQVANYMRGFAYHVASIGVAYREDLSQVKELMHQAFEALREDDLGPDIIGDLEMHGVTELADSAVVIRARIKTEPGMQWAVGRAYNEKIKVIFDANGIEIPYPHMTLYWGEDKQGKAPPLHILPTKSPPQGSTSPSERSSSPSSAQTSAVSPGQITNQVDGVDIPENDE